MKSDIKEIKTLLSGNFVTVEQFEAYKKSQTFVKVVISCITAVITALLTFEITRIFRG